MKLFISFNINFSYVSSPTYEDIVQALQTKTDVEIAEQISKLPNDWKVTNSRGKVKTKMDLEWASWGVKKEGGNLVYLEKAILKKYPPPHKNITQFDSMFCGQIKMNNHIWRHRVCNFIFLEELTGPLQQIPYIFIIHQPNHYVTLVVNGEKYYFYDSLLPKSKVRVP
jgi:hypothetical protein